MEEWTRGHVVAASIGIFTITYGLWVAAGMSLREAMDSSIVDFAVMFYAALMGFFEGGGMFYTLYLRKKIKKEFEDERKKLVNESRVAVLTELEAATQSGETVEEFTARLRKEMNGESAG